MSPGCQLEMTLPWGLLGGVRGDGSANERWRAYAARVAAGFGARRLTVERTAQLLGLERRQAFRLLNAYRREGAGGLVSRRRGRPSSRRKPEDDQSAAFA